MVTTGVRCPVTTLDAASVFDSIHSSLEDLLARHNLFGVQLQILRKRRLHESHIRWRGSSRSGLELCMVLRGTVKRVAGQFQYLHSSLGVALAGESRSFRGVVWIVFG